MESNDQVEGKRSINHKEIRKPEDPVMEPSSENQVNESSSENHVKESCITFLEKASGYIDRVADTIAKKHKIFVLVFIAVLLVVTFARIIAGLVKITSDCKEEKQVAAYFIVKACFAIVSWVVLGMCLLCNQLKAFIGNSIVKVILLTAWLFTLCWLFVGTAWIWGNFDTIKIQCPVYVVDWDAHFINFAVFITVIDYFLFLLFFILLLVRSLKWDQGSPECFFFQK